MYKVLIVDDEVLVRVGLKTTIDWEANGFTVVAEASNGEQAYEQYKKYMPDVIITDIKMPKRDGLWLVEEVRKENQHARILVLTCYDEFSYARKALKVGADDYILKSEVEDEELVEVMQSVKKKLDSYNKAKHIEDKKLMNRNDIKRAVLNDMIKSDFYIDADMAERCGNIGFPVEKSSFAFACIAIDGSIKNTGLVAGTTKQTGNAALNIVLDLFAERAIEYIFINQTGKYVFLLSSPLLTGAELERVFGAAVNSVKQYFDCSMNIVYSASFPNIDSAAAMYKDFINKAQLLFYKKEACISITTADSISFSEASVFNLKKEYNNRFIETIGQENTSKIMELINETGGCFERDNVKPAIVKIFYSNLMAEIFNSYGFFMENNKEFGDHEYYHYQIENSEYLQGITDLLADFTVKLINEIRHIRHANSKVLINRAINYIQYHYDEKISLEDVAEKLHLSKHYLCSSFKKATGENMSLYINKLRIEKAKRLLLEPDGRIKEIFEEVGYSNQQYFSKVFKKITGMTIMEYKENRISNQ